MISNCFSGNFFKVGKLKTIPLFQAITAAGVPRFDLVKQRHGRKYYAKMIKSPKDHAWRDMVVHMIVEVISKPNFESKS